MFSIITSQSDMMNSCPGQCASNILLKLGDGSLSIERAMGDGSCILVFDRLNCCHEIAKRNL